MITNHKKLTSAKFDFNGLVIFELSKNHGGNVQQGLRLVREFSKVAQKAGIRAAIKLQFMNLDSYIHPSLRDSEDSRMRRFFASRLSEKNFKKIVDEIHKQGLISMSTPFDEDSVDMLNRLGVQVLKVASSSAQDWPLLKKVVQLRKPIVCSTGGLRLEEVDKIHDFFKKNKANFALLHCVGMYPTPEEHMQLNRIALMKKRYPNVPIGLSTHERSDTLGAVQIAYALGAQLFEKHVVIPNEKLEKNILFYKISTYTATPEQMSRWLESYKQAIRMCGPMDATTYTPEEKEIETLRTMTRGVFLKSAVKKGKSLGHKDVYFAIILREGQLPAGEWQDGLVADRDYIPDEALSARVVSVTRR